MVVIFGVDFVLISCLTLFCDNAQTGESQLSTGSSTFECMSHSKVHLDRGTALDILMGLYFNTSARS